MSILIARNGFPVCKAGERDAAVATLTDDNAADGNSGKQLVWISAYRHTSLRKGGTRVEDIKNSKEEIIEDVINRDAGSEEGIVNTDKAADIKESADKKEMPDIKEAEAGRETEAEENTECHSGITDARNAGSDNSSTESEGEATVEEEKAGKSFFRKEKKEKKDKKDLLIEELNDRLMRTMAEFDNYRKRSEKEKTQMFEIGARDIIEKILPVIDNFERGLGAITEEEKEGAFAQGIEKIYRQLVTTLTEAGLQPIEAVGKTFDPNYHNAVMHAEDQEQEENVVAEEFQKGYMYKDTVVRHSMVKVVN